MSDVNEGWRETRRESVLCSVVVAPALVAEACCCKHTGEEGTPSIGTASVGVYAFAIDVSCAALKLAE